MTEESIKKSVRERSIKFAADIFDIPESDMKLMAEDKITIHVPVRLQDMINGLDKLQLDITKDAKWFTGAVQS